MANDQPNPTQARAHTAPAEGERRALVGYLPQYELGAWSIMRKLREQTFESVRLGDLDAGRVDDFVILSTNAVDGHSVKWSDIRDTVTFRDFTKPRKNAPCWIAQLADGWKRLCDSYPNRQVTVHFVTCDIPSKGDTCPGDTGRSFASFYHEAWAPFQQDNQAIPEEWSSAWSDLQASSELNEDEFARFAQACHLDFHVRTAADRTHVSRDDELLSKQLKELAAELANMVRDPSRTVEFGRDQLLQRLGWNHFSEFKHRHEFPTRDPYEPIDSTVEELGTKLGSLEGGYVAVLGSPGSGKSTMLTRTLESWLDRHRLIKYYAFVPGSADPRTRGESAYFLHDLVLALEHAGFSAGQSRGVFDRDLLLERLHKQLQLLGDAFEQSGFPTVILVDGLDHIPREQNPQQSLIVDLPLPDQIPKGVFIVLGSQTADLPGLSPAIRQALQQDERRVEVASMSREASLRVVAANAFKVEVTAEQRERIVSLAGGHPLALSLLLNRLRELLSSDAIDEALADTVEFAGDVDAYYFAYWQHLESTPDLAQALGLLARLRRPIDLDWVASWEPRPPLAELRRRFGHLFRRERPGHIVFFHNSFRQYVLSKSVTLLGGTAAVAEKEYHQQLAERCRVSDAPHSWELVYHLAMADETEQVIALATPEYFREQLYALRPIESVARDARFAAASAGHKKDVRALVKAALFLSELYQRAFSLNAWTIGDALLSMGHRDNALEYLWEGAELQIEAAEALRVARQMWLRGDESLARRIFDAAEPLSLLQPASEGDDEQFDRDTSDLLERWAEAAPLFRPIDEVVAMIMGFVPPRSRIGEEADTDHWRSALLFWAAFAMERSGHDQDASVLERQLRDHEGDEPDFIVWLAIHRVRRHMALGKTAAAKLIVDELLGSSSYPTMSQRAKLVIAQAALSLSGAMEPARDALKNGQQPSLSVDGMRELGFADAAALFRYFRLLMLISNDLSPHSAVPDPSEPRDWPRVLLERALVQLARIAADAARGNRYSAGEVRAAVHQPLRLFHRTRKERRQWHNWYRVEQLRDEFDQLVVNVLQEHGPIALEALRAEYERLWSDKDTSRFWASGARRNVVIAMYDAGASDGWARSHLESIASDMLDGHDVAGKLDECAAQAKAWQTLGDNTAALAELKRMVAVSFGVGYRKDYQMDDWIRWLDQVAASSPEDFGERLALYAAAIAGTEESTEGRGTRSAALALIRVCMAVSPRRAVALVRWFEKHGCIDHASAVAMVLEAAASRRACSAQSLLAVYQHLLLRFSTSTHAELAASLLQYATIGSTLEQRCDTCRTMVDAVKARALPAARPFILRALKPVGEADGIPLDACGLDDIPQQPDEQSNDDRSLTLKDGTQLSMADVVERAATVSGLLELFEQSRDSYYRWHDVVESILPQLSRNDVVSLASGLPPEWEHALALSHISKCLSEHGERHLAWTVGEKALSASSPYGWLEYIDGGTRLEALRALVTANEAAGRDRVVDEVAACLSSGATSPFDVARCLLDLVPLMKPDTSLSEFYPCVEEYVRRLSDPLILLPEAMAELADPRDDDTVERALCDLLKAHMTGMVPILAQGATSAMVDLHLRRSPAAERAVGELLDGSERQQVSGMVLLEVLAEQSIERIRQYSDSLRALVLSRNWWISKTSDYLCSQLQLDDVPRRPPRTLPPIYLLALPETDAKEPAGDPGEPLPDSTNPRDLVRPYDHDLEMMGRLAGLDEQNLFIAASREMPQLADDVDLTAAGEAQYRSHLERVNLKLPFRRPRGAAAREAVRRVASDLVDSGRIREEQQAMLLGLLASTDPRLAILQPISRPSEVMPLDGLNEYRSNVPEWSMSASPPFRNHLRNLSGRVVLAEVTTLKGLDWSVPQERRISAIAERAMGALNVQHPFERVFNWRADAYGRASQLTTDPRNPVVIKNQWLGSDTDGTEWIALNPALGKQLGWTHAPDGLFRWVNAAGEVMVETVWWKDGCVELPPYERDSEVGEGFVVAASPSAADEIMGLLSEATRFLLVQRSCIADYKVLDAEAVQFNEPV